MQPMEIWVKMVPGRGTSEPWFRGEGVPVMSEEKRGDKCGCRRLSREEQMGVRSER